MSLAQPAWLALLLLAALLAWLARQRRAARQQEVSALHLWRRVRARSPRARLHPSAALGLQLLALLAAAFALSRPVFAPPAGGGRLVLLDATRAMRATDARPTRFDAARALALREIGPGSGAALLTGGVQPLGLNLDPATLGAALRAAQPGDAAPDWAAAARWLRARARGGPVTVYTSPAQVGAARAALRGLNARILSVGRPDTPNAALTDLRVTPGAAGAPWTLTVTAHAFGLSGPRPLTVRLGGRALARRTVTLVDGAATPITWRFTPGAGGLLELTLDARDALGADDHAALLLRPQPGPVRIAIQGPLAPGSPLARALKALPAARLQTGTGDPADLLIVTDPGIGPDRALASPAPLRLDLNADPARAAPDHVLAWAQTDPVGQTVPWAALGDLRAVTLPARPGAQAVLSGTRGPLLTRETTPDGEIWRAALPPVGAWTDTPAFPVLLATLAARARPDAGAQVPTPCTVGRPCAQPPGPHALREGGLPPRRVWGAFVPARAGVALLDGQPLAVQAQGTDGDLRAPAGATPDAARRSLAPRLDQWLLDHWRLEPWRALVLLALLAVVTEGALRVRDEGSLRRPGAWRTPAGRRWWPWQALAAALLLLAALNPGLQRPQPAPAPVTLAGGGDLDAALADAAARAPGAPLRVTGPGWRVSGTVPDTLARLHDQGHAVQLGPTAGTAAGTTPGTAAGPALAAPVLDVPAGAPAGQPVPATLSLQAARAGEVQLTVRQQGRAVQRGSVQVQPGLTRLTLPLPAPTTALDTYTVEVQAPGVPPVTRQAAVRRDAPTAALLIAPPGAARDTLTRALAVQGLSVTPVSPADLGAAQIRRARQIALVDTPAADLGADLRSALDRAVRDGAHLFIAGDRQAFGPGGYVGTPLETLSPLSGRVPRDQPRLALALVLDKSGSMNEVVSGGVTKLDLIKAAALGSARLLAPQSDVTVIAFDSAPKVAVPLGPASRQAAIEQGVARIEAEGGTVVKRALDAALKELAGSDAPRRHLLLLTDGVDGGIFSPDEYERQIRRIRATGITVSAVTVGAGMHVPLLRRVAEWGGGQFAQATDWRDVPSLLARDTLAQGRPAARQGTFAARWPGAAPLTVRAAVRTTLKGGATPLGRLDLGGDDRAAPLGAAWRVGLGRVTALAVNPASLFGDAGGPARLAPLLRGPPLLPTGPVPLTLVGADLRVQAPTAQVTLLGPDGAAPLRLTPRPDGVFEARLPAPTPGLYRLGPAALEVPPPDALPADLTGAWPTGGPGRAAWQPLWPALTLAALACFLTALVRRAVRSRRAAPQPTT